MHAKPLILLGLCALTACVWSGRVQAKTKCSIDGGAVAFGVYNPALPGNHDVMGVFSFSCNGNYQVRLSLSVGNGAGASYSGGRVMTGVPGGNLVYNLYADASRTVVLGDGTGGSITLEIAGKKTTNQTIWGRIPGSQLAVQPGTYYDIIVATVSY